MPASLTKELYEFGPFRVDPGKEILSRAGESVPLTPKTFQILLVLIRHNTEVVTKDDLMKTVWPDTFVEEANLSRNIFMLRKALGETAQDHRYIVTVPGRGYRLAESVTLVPEQELTVIAAGHSVVRVDVKETWPWKWIAGAAVLLALAGGTWRLLWNRAGVLGAKDTVVLGGFTNSTGDALFDETLRQGLAIQLEQSPFLSVISDQRIHNALRLMGHPSDVRLTPELSREICERTGSAAVLEGSISRLGSQYVLALRAKSCHTGDTLDEEQAEAATKEGVLNALSQIAGKFRTRVGESLSTIERYDTPLAEATTPSLEALQLYSVAWKVHSSSGAMAALPLFKRATEIDPTFSMAHASLGRIYADLDESDMSAESTRRAWQLRDRASEREKFFISAGYETLVTGNLEMGRQICEAWARTYPRDARPHTLLSGGINKFAGRYEAALAEARRSIDLEPDFAIAFYNLAVNNVYLGRLEEADNILRRAAGRGLEIDEFIMLDYDLAFLQGDQARMKREAARARGRSGGETWMSNKESFALAYSGDLQQARSMSRRAIDQSIQEGQRGRAGQWEAGAALREALFGNVSEAGKRATAALNLSRGREEDYGAAFALALSGNSTKAQALADDLAKRFPEDTTVRFSYLPALRARIALNHGEVAKALSLLEVAVPSELGASRVLFGALYPVYVRGEAYLAAHQGAEAAAEFQRILDHRGIVGSDPIGALAHLQLGRAFALSGDQSKAKIAYGDFFAIWKEADNNIPILKQARAEFAKL